MTHHIHHTYDEILPASLPGLEVHVQYHCESEIHVDDDGEHDPRLLCMAAQVNGSPVHFEKFPLESDGQQAREFLAKLRENARQVLWAKALEAAKKAGYIDPQDINAAAYRWQATGSAKLPVSFPLEKPFVI